MALLCGQNSLDKLLLNENSLISSFLEIAARRPSLTRGSVALAGARQSVAQLGGPQEALEIAPWSHSFRSQGGWAAGILLTSFDESHMRRVAFKPRPLDYKI